MARSDRCRCHRACHETTPKDQEGGKEERKKEREAKRGTGHAYNALLAEGVEAFLCHPLHGLGLTLGLACGAANAGGALRWALQ